MKIQGPKTLFMAGQWYFMVFWASAKTKFRVKTPSSMAGLQPLISEEAQDRTDLANLAKVPLTLLLQNQWLPFRNCNEKLFKKKIIHSRCWLQHWNCLKGLMFLLKNSQNQGLPTSPQTPSASVDQDPGESYKPWAQDWGVGASQNQIWIDQNSSTTFTVVKFCCEDFAFKRWM